MWNLINAPETEIFGIAIALMVYLFQTAFATVFGSYLNGTLAAVIVWFLSLPLVRVTASGLYKIMPKDETTAVSQESLIGRVGTVVLGEARVGNAAQVRVKDVYGQQHYVMVEPDSEDVLKQGDAVLLVSLDGNTFKAILNPNGSLVD